MDSNRVMAIVLILLMTTGLTMADKFKEPCNIDSDCQAYYGPKYECEKETLTCRHELLFPFKRDIHAIQIIGFILVIVATGLANAGGIGGGAILTPIFIFLFGYTFQESIPLSKATILAGAIANLFIIVGKPHPKNKNEYLIDFGLSSVILPIVLPGTVTGVLLNKFLPPILVLVILAIYLMITTIDIYTKAKSLYAKETADLANETSNKEDLPLLSLEERKTHNLETQDIAKGPNQILENRVHSNKLEANHIVSVIPQEKEKDFLENQRDIQSFSPIGSTFKDIGIIMIALITLILMALLRGGHGLKSIVGIDTCSSSSWVIFCLAHVVCFICAYIAYQKHIDRLTEPFNPHTTKENLHSLMKNSYFVGIISGLLGVGGGIVMNPVMLNLGFLPEVAGALSSFCVLFTSSSTTTQFIIQGAITIQDSVVFLVVSAVGSLIGGYLISKLVEIHRRPSYLIWLLFGLLVLSMIILPTLGVYRIFQTGILGFENPC